MARSLAASGNEEAAKNTYLTLLSGDPDHVPALVELGTLAEATGHLSAARSAWQRAVTLDPNHAIAQTCLANTLAAIGNVKDARKHYQAALRGNPDCIAARRGLAGLLFSLNDPEAEIHARAGYAGKSTILKRYRGTGPGIPLLLLFSARGGNIDTGPWIDDRRYAVTAICADYHDMKQRLLPHNLIVNAIGDADLCPQALENADRIVRLSGAPVINAPAWVRQTTRLNNAHRLAAIPGVVVPRTASIGRNEVNRLADRPYPFLLRSVGFHTGQHFLRIDEQDDLADAAGSLPGGTLLAIDYHDCRGADGLFRKYRVMFIGGRLYPLHMAASEHWKVHYFSAAMASSAEPRSEEAAFLSDMPQTIGPKAMEALSRIAGELNLDYAGIDFTLTPDGDVLVFEANATMVMPPPPPDPIWAYRRPARQAALAAAQSLLSGTRLSAMPRHTKTNETIKIFA
jgi:hypothetical protein